MNDFPDLKVDMSNRANELIEAQRVSYFTDICKTYSLTRTSIVKPGSFEAVVGIAAIVAFAQSLKRMNILLK